MTSNSGVEFAELAELENNSELEGTSGLEDTRVRYETVRSGKPLP